MLQLRTKIKIVDNSGVLEGSLIDTRKKNYARCGDKILLSVKKIRSFSKFKIGSLVEGIVVRTQKTHISIGGNATTFLEGNSVVLIKDNTPIGKRFRGALSLELRHKKNLRVLSLANEFV